YTSYLIVPDGPVPVANRPANGKPDVHFNLGFGGGSGGGMPSALQGRPGSGPVSVADFAKEAQKKAGGVNATRSEMADKGLAKLPEGRAKDDVNVFNLQQARDRFLAQRQAGEELKKGRGYLANVQSG